MSLSFFVYHRWTAIGFSRPRPLAQLLASDDTTGLLHPKHQDVKGLWLKLEAEADLAQLPRLHIEFKQPEGEKRLARRSQALSSSFRRWGKFTPVFSQARQFMSSESLSHWLAFS